MNITRIASGSACEVTDWPWPHEDPEWFVNMVIEVMDDRWRPISFALRPMPGRRPGAVDTALLRKVPLADIARQAAIIADAQDEPGLLAVEDFIAGLNAATKRELKSRVKSVQSAGPRGSGHRLGGDFYRFIAELFELAQERSDRPGRLVADIFQVNIETSRSWIKRAHQWREQDQMTARWEATKADRANKSKEVTPPADKE